VVGGIHGVVKTWLCFWRTFFEKPIGYKKKKKLGCFMKNFSVEQIGYCVFWLIFVKDFSWHTEWTL
jgi:hypothetical protein